MSISMKISKACASCGLYKKTQYPFLHKQEPRWYDPTYKMLYHRILVVGSGPHEGYDRFFSNPSGEAVRNLGDLIEAGTVVYHEAIACASSKPTKKHLKRCRQETFEDVMALYRPKVVIVLGGNALYWVTGDEEQKLNQYRHKVTTMGNFHLLALPHLSNDIRYCPDYARKRAEDLYDEYFHTFYLAERICKYKGYREPSKDNWEIVTSKKEAMSIANRMRGNELPCAMDVETGQSMHSVTGQANTNPDRLTLWHEGTKFCCTSWTFAEKIADVPGPTRTFGEYEYRTFVLFDDANCRDVNYTFFKPWEKKKRRVVGHNIKFDNNVHYKFFGYDGWQLADCYDTFYHFSLLDQSKIKYGLKPLAKFYFGAPDWDEDLKDLLKEMFKEANKNRSKDDPVYIDYSNLTPLQLGWYNAQDTYYTLRLYLEIACDDAYPKPDPLAVQVCLRQAQSLSRIERFGLPLNRDTFHRASEANYLHYLQARKDFANLRTVRKALSRGVEFNIDSKKFQAELVDITGVTVPTTPTGLPSVKAPPGGVLHKIGGVTTDKNKDIVPREEWDSPSQETWWKYANLKKLEHRNKNFFDSYGKFIVNDFIRPDFRVCRTEKGGSEKFSGDTGGGTKTGRLSSSNPQGQNLGGSPVIRACFTAPKYLEMPKGLQAFEKRNIERLVGHEWLLVEADYDRKELVFLAYASQDPKMLEIINSGRDMHTETARELFDIPHDEEVPKEKRDIAKNLNFGLVYGQGPRAFAEAAGIKLHEAQAFFKKFHSTFPNVRKFFRENEAKIKNGELIKSMYGRLRSFMLTGDRKYDQGQEREANNTLIQGAASDSTTEHLYFIFRQMDRKPTLHNYIIPINTVHDSIWFLVRRDKWRPCCRQIKRWMEDTRIYPFPFNARLGVEVKVGKSLDKMKEVKL